MIKAKTLSESLENWERVAPPEFKENYMKPLENTGKDLTLEEVEECIKGMVLHRKELLALIEE